MLTGFKSSLAVAVATLTVLGCKPSPTNPAPAVNSVVGLSLSDASIVAERNSTIQVTAQAQMSNGVTTDVTASATWSSSNPRVAAVASGLVSVIGLGNAVITVTYQGKTSTGVVTGRRRMHFGGTINFRDAAEERTILGLQIMIDDTSPYPPAFGSTGRNGSVGVRSVSYDVYGSDDVRYSITPGMRRLALRVFLIGGTHDIIAEPWDLTLYDSDTFEPLLTIRLGERRGVLRSEETLTWTFDVPVLSQ